MTFNEVQVKLKFRSRPTPSFNQSKGHIEEQEKFARQEERFADNLNLRVRHAPADPIFPAFQFKADRIIRRQGDGGGRSWVVWKGAPTNISHLIKCWSDAPSPYPATLSRRYLRYSYLDRGGGGVGWRVLNGEEGVPRREEMREE